MAMQQKKSVISIKDLSKRYPGQDDYALSRLSLDVNKGEAYGFLGPNGAGKSTTIRLLLNFIQPTSGTATILGRDIVAESVEIMRNVGYLAGDVALYKKMTGAKFLDYMAELQPVKRRDYRNKLVLALQANLTQPLATLSKGNRQKIGLIQAFMHEPEVFILDEPTSGLDPLMQGVFYQLIAEAKARGASIFVSSHDLSEVEKICDRIGFIRNGELLNESSISELALEASQVFDITFVGKPPLAELKKIPGVAISKAKGTAVTVRMSGELSPLFAVLGRHKVADLDRREINLEQSFMRYYEGERL